MLCEYYIYMLCYLCVMLVHTCVMLGTHKRDFGTHVCYLGDVSTHTSATHRV